MLDRDRIIDRAMAGMDKAWMKYWRLNERWTGKISAEYILTTFVAEELSQEFYQQVAIEPMLHAMFGGAYLHFDPPFETGQLKKCKADIAVIENDLVVRCLIEVKRTTALKSIFNDVRRSADFISRSGNARAVKASLRGTFAATKRPGIALDLFGLCLFPISVKAKIKDGPEADWGYPGSLARRLKSLSSKVATLEKLLTNITLTLRVSENGFDPKGPVSDDDWEGSFKVFTGAIIVGYR
jgi:hypothetical protein